MTIFELKNIFSEMKKNIFQSTTENQIENHIDKTFNLISTKFKLDLGLNVDKTFKSLANKLKADLILSLKQKTLLVNSKIKNLSLFERLKINKKKLKTDIFKKIGIKKTLSIRDRLKKEYNKVKRDFQNYTHKIIEKTKNFCGKKVNKNYKVYKTWICRFINSRDAHIRLNNQRVDITENFKIDGFETDYPGNFGVARLDCNCHCKVVYERVG